MARIAVLGTGIMGGPMARNLLRAGHEVEGRSASMSALPIDRPSKIVCVGLNYRDHAEEQGTELPSSPLLFAKWPNALIGPGESIVIPRVSKQVDYEAELGVVIGERVRSVSQENALEAVRGYLCLNDVSARDLQFSDGQWTRGKSPDTFCPIGPRLVPAADVPDPQALGIRCLLNGEVMQDSTTANMIFTVAEVIAYASQTMTLEPGDLIATGTPAGVGVFRDPPVLMKDGDQVTIEIDLLGSLTNPVQAER
jgi:2-keto-4-pentenoate hydratase/2-oxohepta-3-ene-1,7-dioic acid hydratase in catechol pathway